MSRFQNFTLKEFIESSTAKRLGIDNTPDFQHVLNLEELTDKILQPLRVAWGSGLRINSGYRCPALNKAVGGVATSAHLSGYAADIWPINGKFEEFVIFAERWLKAKDISFDQSIIERQGSVKWWHIGIRNQFGLQRRKCLAIDMIGK